MNSAHIIATPQDAMRGSVNARPQRAAPDSLLAWLLWGTVAASISPLPASLLGIGGNLIFLIGCGAFFIIFFGVGRRYPIGRAWIAFLPILLASPAAIYWREAPLAVFPVYLVASLLTLAAANKKLVIRFCSVATTTLVIVTIGAWVGFIYAFLGGPSLFWILNPDGRVNEFFFSTFSNWSIGTLIRPSGLFDEPGTLSFLICLIAALRSHLNQSKKITWILLGLGLVTTSIAHVIYMACHAYQDRQLFPPKRAVFFVAILVGIAAIATVDLPDSVEADVFLSRFVVENGRLGGDTRSQLLTSALSRIDLDSFLFGLDSDCILRPTVCATKNYGDFGETPAGMILLLGIFLAAPYFFVLGATLRLAFKRRSVVLVGVFLLLLQRPYVLTFGYSLIILLVVFGAPIRSSTRHGTRAARHLQSVVQTSNKLY